MYVRLAFAVAAHLDPEILIVDEVLAVGDAEFQKKCLGKMAAISGQGRTVLFVSHNMGAVRRLCSRCVLLEDGRVAVDAVTATAISHYINGRSSDTGGICWTDGIANPGVSEFSFLGVRVLDANHNSTAHLQVTDTMTVELEYRIHSLLRNCRIGFVLSSSDGTPIMDVSDTDNLLEAPVREPGDYVLRCVIPESRLMAGKYTISPNAGIPFVRSLAFIESALTLELHEAAGAELGKALSRQGFLRPAVEWKCRQAVTVGVNA
jgi:lipopolysaccharide transport system ATP-binding protein